MQNLPRAQQAHALFYINHRYGVAFAFLAIFSIAIAFFHARRSFQ